MFEKKKRIQIMKNSLEVKHANLPYQLLCYTNEHHHDQNYLFTLYTKIKQIQDYIIIMNCTVNIKKSSYKYVSFQNILSISNRLANINNKS